MHMTNNNVHIQRTQKHMSRFEAKLQGSKKSGNTIVCRTISTQPQGKDRENLL